MMSTSSTNPDAFVALYRPIRSSSPRRRASALTPGVIRLGRHSVPDYRDKLGPTVDGVMGSAPDPKRAPQPRVFDRT